LKEPDAAAGLGEGHLLLDRRQLEMGSLKSPTAIVKRAAERGKLAAPRYNDLVRFAVDPFELNQPLGRRAMTATVDRTRG